MNKKATIALTLGFGFFFLIVLLFTLDIQKGHFTLTHRLAAQIITIETSLLKEWQQHGSLERDLTFNADGSEVTLVQKMLSQDTPSSPTLEITGHYGEVTASAVRTFQKEYGLPDTGVVDTATRKKLNEIFFSQLCPKQINLYPDFLWRKITPQSPLPSDYVPPLLEDIGDTVPAVGVTCLRHDVARNLRHMFFDAKRDGVELMVTSGYRKPAIQKYLYDFWIQIEGDKATDEIAKPGLSEHQLGSAVDLTDSSIGFKGVDPSFAKSKGGRWLRANAPLYGFFMSYPEGKEGVTGFTFEPWHWRFIGIEPATTLSKKGLTYTEGDFDTTPSSKPKNTH